MASRKCPFCGKKIAAHAQYCIYCSRRLDDLQATGRIELDDTSGGNDRGEIVSKQENASKTSFYQSKRWLAVSVAALIVIVVSIVLIIMSLFSDTTPPVEPLLSPATTTATRDPQRDEWLQSFTGRWVDEQSTGKGSLEKQGGQLLFIHEIRRDAVLFDLLSYSGGENPRLASVNGIEATLENDTLHFDFANDGCGHSGEGHMRLVDGHMIELEVEVDGQELLGEDEHSLATNAVFMRVALPTSSGHDLQDFATLDDVLAVAGEQTAESVTDEKTGEITYTFGMLKAVADPEGQLKFLTVDYSQQDNKSLYCFDCVDGTMTYDTVKAYFGEAVHDYVEQPTNICVLYYELTDKAVTFTFDAENNLLVLINYVV